MNRMASSSTLAQKQDIPTHSEARNAMGTEAHLLLSNPPPNHSIGEEVIYQQRTFTAAILLAVAASGLDDKEVYIPLDIDSSRWTKIKKGEAHFPVDKLNDFCDLVGNEIALIWWAHSRGKGLVTLEGESQRLLRLERERADELERENKLMRDLLKGRG